MKHFIFVLVTLGYLFLTTLALHEARLHKSVSKHHHVPKSCPFYGGIFTSMMRRIFNPGFHKDLLSEIEIMLTTSILPPVCTLVVEETMPRGMYVDPDQLRDLQDQGLSTYVPTKVDVEKPEFESESFRVFIFRKLLIQENLRITDVKLPVHLRYHKPAKITELKPSSTAPSAIIKLQNPRLLLSCEGENIVTNCPEKAVTSFCDSTGTEKCEYLHIPYEVNVNAIEVSVPVGNIEHAPYVVGLTTFVVSGSTVYLCVTLFRKYD